MPLYEYVCEDCKKEFDVLRSMKDADKPIECKSCSSAHTHRKLSVCFAKSDGHAVSSSGGCSGCSGGSCSGCHH